MQESLEEKLLGFSFNLISKLILDGKNWRQVGCGWRKWFIGGLVMGHNVLYLQRGVFLSLLSDHHVSYFTLPHSSAMMSYLTSSPKEWSLLPMNWDL